MDTSLIGALLGAQAGNTRLGVAADFMRMNADSDQAIAQIVDAAAQNAKSLDTKSLANIPAGVGSNLDVTT
jgi:hypothetical protein